VYDTTPNFQAIKQHACVCDQDKNLFAVTGPAGDKASEKVAEVFSAAFDMMEALFFLGGGNLYLLEFGRLCFCPAHGLGEKHADSCEMAWAAYKKACGDGPKMLPEKFTKDDLLLAKGHLTSREFEQAYMGTFPRRRGNIIIFAGHLAHAVDCAKRCGFARDEWFYLHDLKWLKSLREGSEILIMDSAKERGDFQEIMDLIQELLVEKVLEVFNPDTE